jgi:hypothetical protein
MKTLEDKEIFGFWNLNKKLEQKFRFVVNWFCWCFLRGIYGRLNDVFLKFLEKKLEFFFWISGFWAFQSPQLQISPKKSKRAENHHENPEIQ